MDLASALRFLKLDEIPQAWVDAVWDLEFTERKPLEGTFENRRSPGNEAFRALHRCVYEHAAGSDAASQSIWAALGENNVSLKSLVAVLSYFVLGAKAKGADVRQRIAGLNAASVYLLLLAVPGSIANRVFHEVLLDTCADLTSHCWPQESGKKRKKDGLKSSQADGKRSKQRKDSPEMELDEEEEEVHFSDQDVMKIRDAVVLLVQSLLRLLQTLSLKDRPQTARDCAQIFSKLLYFEPVFGEPAFAAAQDITKLGSVPEMAFHGLKLLCSPKHGDQKESLSRVLYRLLYVILMMNKDNGGRPTLLEPGQAVLSIREQAVHFVCHLMDELEELALPSLHVLLQHICFQMVERSDFRSRGARAVGTLTSRMGATDYSCFIKWLWNLSRSSKMVHRLFSVDVVMVLLEQPERRLEECLDPESACFLPQRFLTQNLLFARWMDNSPTVQGHALACLAQCLELPSLNVTRAVHSLFSATGTQTGLEGETTEGTLSSRTLPFRTVAISTNDGSCCACEDNLALLLRRVGDPKINVRRSALQALLGLLKHDVLPVTWENLTALCERCRDAAVSVKKKALQCLGELLAAKPECTVVQKAWLQGVVPAAADSESSVQDKALEALDRVLLSHIKPYSASHPLDASQRLTWDLLGLICHECQNLSKYFSRAFTIWSKQNKFSSEFVTGLVSHIDADHAAGAWLLLSKVAASASKLSCKKILDAWDHMISSKDVSVPTCCHILHVVGDIAVGLDEDTKDRIVSELLSWLKTFTLSLEVISAAVGILYQLGSNEDMKQTQAFLNRHGGELVSVSEAYLAGILLSEGGAQNLDEDLMVKHLHTLGVASLQCPARVSRRTVLLVESVFTSHSDKRSENQEGLPASLPLSQFRTISLSTKVRAHGVITLGKLCLQHEDLVQKYLPVFARELEVGSEVAVRNNLVVVMCDLCVRYTNMVDRYIPNVAACLLDDEAIIREQTLIMLTNLVQEEFVRWRGSLFFCFVVVLVDPVPAIVSLCEYCLLHLLLKKNPEMFSQHFIECIFYFNSYSKHKSYNRFPRSEREKVRFSLKGSLHRDKRFHIYRFLLKHFTDTQRFNVTNRINQTVLACFADEELPLDADGAELLSETFKVLSLKEMKLKAISAAGEEPEEEENMATMAKAVLQAAHKKVVSQVQKKAFIENTVPLIIGLKALLEQRRSPVLRDLMAYLHVTMQDYRSEVKEFFSGDEQLAAELEFALKKAQTGTEEQVDGDALTGGTGTPPARRSVRFSGPPPPIGSVTPSLPPPNPPSAGPSSAGSRVRRSILEDRLQSKSVTPEKTVLPKGAVEDRAISTPAGPRANFTFDEGLSAIFSDRGTSPAENAGVPRQTPGPRRWSVQSPLR
ncbi:condensin-2 complex subunit D3 [Brachionichthys hirsutus]|uniref:condensin-2 complex subunit D3 n=1 Tax=Brachionichthys hirsutus TaxID=412623 RepID=UPI0036047F8B